MREKYLNADHGTGRMFAEESRNGFLIFQVRRHHFNGKQTADGMAFVASQTLAQYSQPLHSMGQLKAE